MPKKSIPSEVTYEISGTKDTRHSFKSAAKGMNTSDKALMCQLYLLTADRKLWQISKPWIDKNRIPLQHIHLRAGGEELLSSLLCERSDDGNETREYRRSCRHDSDYAADV